MNSSVAIVGGGIFGATAAFVLKQRGYSVTIFDRSPLPNPDAATTDVSKIVRMDYGADAFYSRMAGAALMGWERWNAQLDRPLYHQDGFLILASEEMAPGGFEFDSFQTISHMGYPLERLDGGKVGERYPWSGANYPDGYFNPRGGWAESGRVLENVLQDAIATGVEIRTGVTCSGFLFEDGVVRGITTEDGEEYPADSVVVAAGAWTPYLLPWMQDVLWVSGHPVLRFRPEDAEPFSADRFPPWAADIAGTGWYGFPALPDGSVKVANHGPGIRVDPRDPRRVPEGTEERFREFLAASLPALADAPLVEQRLCLYCDSIDGDFWIDKDPEHEGLVVASGGSGHAFKFAPLLGGLIADAVEGLSDRWAHRFLWRAPTHRVKEAARYSDHAVNRRAEYGPSPTPPDPDR